MFPTFNRGPSRCGSRFFSETFLPKVDGIVTRFATQFQSCERRVTRFCSLLRMAASTTLRARASLACRPGGFPLYPELKLALPRRSVGSCWRISVRT